MEIWESSLQEWFPYATLLGLTVDTRLALVNEAFWKNFTPFIREDIPVVAQMQIPLVRLPRDSPVAVH